MCEEELSCACLPRCSDLVLLGCCCPFVVAHSSKVVHILHRQLSTEQRRTVRLVRCHVPLFSGCCRCSAIAANLRQRSGGGGGVCKWRGHRCGSCFDSILLLLFSSLWRAHTPLNSAKSSPFFCQGAQGGGDDDEVDSIKAADLLLALLQHIPFKSAGGFTYSALFESLNEFVKSLEHPSSGDSAPKGKTKVRTCGETVEHAPARLRLALEKCDQCSTENVGHGFRARF